MMGNMVPDLQRLIYFVDSPEHPFDLSKVPTDLGCEIVKVPIANWNDALTPWPAQGLRHREPFGGRADATLAELLERIDEDDAACAEASGSPIASDVLSVALPCAIAGYSLGGLFALYAFTRSDRFRAVASLSGSLWYDGWSDYLADADFPGAGRFAYLSLGTKEKRGMRERLKTVEDETRRTETILRNKGVETQLVLTPGAHFDHVEDRIAAGLAALAAKI